VLKQEELQLRAREELSLLETIGIDPGMLRKQKAEYPPRSTVVENTVVDSTTVDIRNNYFKCDNDVSDLLAPTQTLAEQAVYRRLYRLAYGFRKNSCRVGMGSLARACNIGSSNKTVKKAVEGLIAKNHISVIQEAGNDKAGTLYRVFLPCEIPGMESSTVVKTTTVENTTVNSTTVENTTPTVVNSTIVENTTVPQSRAMTGLKPTVVNSTTVENTTIKERHIKDTLSPDPVTIFYTNIGQKRISKTKRERGNKVVQDLLAEGFTVEDIVYAAQWTSRNTTEQVYDMEILKHTIGQALSARMVADKAQKAKAEADAGREAGEARRAKYEEVKKGMSDKERLELRARAEADIRNSGKYKEEFITEMLIETRENELLSK